MKVVFGLISAILLILSPVHIFAEGKHNHEKKEKHCKKNVDGKHVILEQVKTRKECKQKGGRWVKLKDNHKKKDHHGHTKGKSHKH